MKAMTVFPALILAALAVWGASTDTAVNAEVTGPAACPQNSACDI